MFSTDQLQRQAVHHAAGMGLLSTVRLLLSRGVPVDVPDYGGSSPLHHAAAQGHRDVVEFLLEKVKIIIVQNKKLSTAIITEMANISTKRPLTLLRADANHSLKIYRCNANHSLYNIMQGADVNHTLCSHCREQIRITRYIYTAGSRCESHVMFTL